MADGWIRLDRSIQKHWIWQDAETARAWIDLLLLANFEDKKMPYKGEIITCKRGDVNLSLSALAKRWDWNRWKVKRFLELLENDGMVTTKCTTHRTTITIENYGFFQDARTTKCTTKRTTNAQPMHITNNNNNTNNINNITRFKKSKGFSDFDNKQGYDMNKIEGMLLNDN